MAKGKRPFGRQYRRNGNTKPLSKSQKEHLRKYGELHPVDQCEEEEKVVKKARRDVASDKRPKECGNLESKQGSQEHQDDIRGDEDDEDPYMELVASFGQNSTAYVNQLTEMWKEEESSACDEDNIRDYSKELQDNCGNEFGSDVGSPETNNEKDEGTSDKEHNNNNDDGGDENDNDDDDDGNENDDDDDDIHEPENKDPTDYRKEDNMASDSDHDNNTDDDDGNSTVNKNRDLNEITDPFTEHFQQDIEENFEKKLQDQSSWKQTTYRVPSLGNVTELKPSAGVREKSYNINEETWYSDLKVKAKLGKRWQAVNSAGFRNGVFTSLQQDLFPYINSYKDVFYSNRTFQNADEIRRLFCLHAVNHILKTRTRVIKNNAKIVQSWKDKKDIGDQRDQGLTRPKVLILVPFKDAALKVVEVIMELVCPAGEGQVMNKKRFYHEFTEEGDTKNSKDSRPEDFKQMFAGNIDDCFRLGIAITKKCVKLYAKFYSSDMIVASPLGLRTIIGNEGEKNHEHDFLSSIEVLIADQTDVFLMQNWEHVQHVFNHLHKQPREAHGLDFSRVRMWCLNGWSKYYRQTLIFSSFTFPEINSLFNKHCHNFAGKVKASLANIPGSICQVAVQIPQAFHCIKCSSFLEDADRRFNTFVNKILPEFKGSLMGYTAIFVPSYFDFVRLRNYFKRESIDCAQISEYSKNSEIQRARTQFQQGRRPFLLFTERFYFFYRYCIQRIRHIIFYELPHYSTFYPEILNSMDARRGSSGERFTSVTCTVLYNQFNTHRLAGVVGTQRCCYMLSSEKDVYMFVNDS